MSYIKRNLQPEIDGTVDTYQPTKLSEYQEQLRLQLINKRFGRFKVLSFSDIKSYKSYWICICDCGNERRVLGSNLTTGKSTNCGCIRKISVALLNKKNKTIHGFFGTRFYGIWQGMKRRPYVDIKVDKKWQKFINFKNDMYDSYLKHADKYGEKNTTLDRIDGNLGYAKENCRWATYSEQANNRKTNVFVEVNGIRKTISQWAATLGLTRGAINQRIKKGYSLVEAVTIPRLKEKYGKIKLI